MARKVTSKETVHNTQVRVRNVAPQRKTTRDQRPKAPDAKISREPYVDDRTKIVQRAKVALGEKAEGMAFFFGDSRKTDAIADYYQSLGYEPVMIGGKQEHHREDLLWMRPATELEREMDASAEESVARFDESFEGTADKYGVRSASGETHAPFMVED